MYVSLEPVSNVIAGARDDAIVLEPLPIKVPDPNWVNAK